MKKDRGERKDHPLPPISGSATAAWSELSASIGWWQYALTQYSANSGCAFAVDAANQFCAATTRRYSYSTTLDPVFSSGVDLARILGEGTHGLIQKAWLGEKNWIVGVEYPLHNEGAVWEGKLNFLHLNWRRRRYITVTFARKKYRYHSRSIF